MASSKSPPSRVMLWALSRTLSTVFLKCMSSVDGIQAILEPFEAAKYFGPERVIFEGLLKDTEAELDEQVKLVKNEEINAPLAYDDTLFTYDWVKKLLEADYPGKKLVFCKDMVTAIEGKYEALPSGFRHTFIIRNPLKVFLSNRKVLIRMLSLTEEQGKAFRYTDVPPQFFNPPKHMFGEMLDLLHYLKENQMESNPVVIDADDLLNNPESILRQYCEYIGVPFSDKLLQWEAGDGITLEWITSKKMLQTNKVEQGGFFARAFASSQFEAPRSLAPDESELTPDVIELAKAADKYYKQLYELRLKK